MRCGFAQPLRGRPGPAGTHCRRPTSPRLKQYTAETVVLTLRVHRHRPGGIILAHASCSWSGSRGRGTTHWQACWKCATLAQGSAPRPQYPTRPHQLTIKSKLVLPPFRRQEFSLGDPPHTHTATGLDITMEGRPSFQPASLHAGADHNVLHSALSPRSRMIPPRLPSPHGHRLPWSPPLIVARLRHNSSYIVHNYLVGKSGTHHGAFSTFQPQHDIRQLRDGY